MNIDSVDCPDPSVEIHPLDFSFPEFAATPKEEVAMVELLSRTLSAKDLASLTGVTERTIRKVRQHLSGVCNHREAYDRLIVALTKDDLYKQLNDKSTSIGQMAMSKELTLQDKLAKQKALDGWYTSSVAHHKNLQTESCLFDEQDNLTFMKQRYLDQTIETLSGNINLLGHLKNDEKWKDFLHKEADIKRRLSFMKEFTTKSQKTLDDAMRIAFTHGIKGIFNKAQWEMKKLREQRRTRYSSKKAAVASNIDNKAAVVDSIIDSEAKINYR